eukprot:s93_g4.t1
MEISVVPDVADVKDKMRCSRGQKVVPEDNRTQSQKGNFGGQNGLFREKKRRTCCLCCSLKEAVRTWFALRHWRDWLQGDGRGQLVSLLAAAMLLIGSGTVVWSAIGGDENANSSWEQSSWISWGLFFDPGTQTGVSAGAPTKVKATALIFSVLGFLYNLTFLGIIVEWIRSSMDRWSKTKSRIWYGNHILILGWSEKTLYLLNELFEALRSSGDLSVSVVVLAEREHSEMHQEVQQHFYQIWEDLSFFDRRWRLLNSLKLREGITHEGDSLERAGASHAQEIIILSREGDQRNADLETVRVMMALSSLREPVKCKVFAEVQMHEVETVLRRLHPDPTGTGTQVIHARAACNHILSLLATDQTVGGIITDLCSFTSGEELYVIQPLPEWQTFGEARRAFDRAVCIGVEATKTVANAHGTRIDLCPSDDRPMEAQERLLVMASNWADVEAPTNSLFHWRSVDPDFMPSMLVSGQQDVFSKAPANARSSTPVDFAEGARKRVYVVIGWPADFAEVLALLDEKVPRGTEVHVLSERTEEQRATLCAGKGQRNLRNVALEHYVGPRTSRKMLEQLPLKKALDGEDGESQSGAILILAQLAGQFLGISEQIADDDEVGGDPSDAIACTSRAILALRATADSLERALQASHHEAYARAPGSSAGSSHWDLVSDLPSPPACHSPDLPVHGYSSSYNQVADLITTVPQSQIELCARLGSTAEESRQRAQRAWEAGLWAKATLEGKIPKPRPTPKLALRPTVYLVIRGPGVIHPVRVGTATEYFRLVPRFTEDSVSHSFPSIAEAKLKTVDKGPLFLYVLTVPPEIAILDQGNEVLAVPVITRRNGVLLAVASGVLPVEVLAAGETAPPTDMIGPHRTLHVEALTEEEDGTEADFPAGMLVDLVDFHASVLPLLRECDPVTDSGALPFLADFPEVVPKPASLLTQAYEWLHMSEEDRINYYTAVEDAAETPRPKQSAPVTSAGIPAPKKPAKRVTAAALSEQVSGLAQTLPALTQQLEQLQAQQKRLEEAVNTGTAQQQTPAYRQPFQTPPALPSRANVRSYLTGIGPPPEQSQSPQSLPLAYPLEDEAKFSSGRNQGFFQEGTPTERPGSAQGAVHAESCSNAHRRLSPAVQVPQSLDDFGSRALFTKYLEKHGGYAGSKDLGLAMWLVAQVADQMIQKDWIGAQEMLALAMVSIEQAAHDGNKWEVAWLLALQEEPPTTMFASRPVATNPRLRAFSPLCPPEWATTILSYVKELDIINSRRTEVLPGKKTPASQTEDQDRDGPRRRPPRSECAMPSPAPTWDRMQKFSFEKWCSQLCTKVLRSRTSFAEFLKTTFHAERSSTEASSQALFPLPIPKFGIFATKRGGSRERRRAAFDKAFHIIVMAVNYWHADFCFVPARALAVVPNSAQLECLASLRRFLKAFGSCGGEFHVPSSGRRTSSLLSQLSDLTTFMTTHGLNSEGYHYGFQGIPQTDAAYFPVPADDSKAEELRPYRPLDASRLKISGEASWDPRPYLSDDMHLAYVEPNSLIWTDQPPALDFPDLTKEKYSSVVGLVKLWDSRGLLTLREVERLSICISDRRDFYHQFKITNSRATTNGLWPLISPEDLATTNAYAEFLRSKGAKKTYVREQHGDGFAEEQRSHHRHSEESTSACLQACFASLPRGDHLGVEFATDSHRNLLKQHGLLAETEELRSDRVFRGFKRLQGLVIDDYYSISITTDPLRFPAAQREELKATGPTASVRCFETAQLAYSQQGLLGSRDKDVVDSCCAKVTGGELDSRLATRELGLTLLSAPVTKRLALPFMSLLDKAYKLVPTSELSQGEVRLIRQPRDVAEELVMLAILCPLMSTNLAATIDDRIYASDSSDKIGAFCQRPAPEQLVRALWRTGRRRGGYTRMLTREEALIRKPDATKQEHEFVLSGGALQDFSEPPDRPIAFRYHFIEVCGGAGKISKFMSERGWAVGPVLDLDASPHYDLAGLELLRWIFFMLEKGRLDSLMLEPPCTTFSPAQYPASRSWAMPRGFNPQDPKTLLGTTLALRSLACIKLASDIDVPGLLETPRRSKMRRLQEWLWLLASGAASEVFTDSCMFGSPHQKGFTFLVTNLNTEGLSRKCDWSHQHIPIQGQYTKSSAVYVDGLAKQIAACFDKSLQIKRIRSQCHDPKTAGLESPLVNDVLLSAEGPTFERLSIWLAEEGVDIGLIVGPGEPDIEAANVLLERYGRELYKAGRPYGHYAETINAVSAAKPRLRRVLQPAWDLAYSWLRQEPPIHHVALPWQLLLSILTTALSWGWTRVAGVIALSWGVIARIGEVLAAQRRNLVLPVDIGQSICFALLEIQEPKTRFRTARHQAARLDQPQLLRVVEIAFQSLLPHQKLWPQSAQTMRARFQALLDANGVGSMPHDIKRGLDLGSLRAGGASWLLLTSEDSELTRRRGRWINTKIMEIYVQEVPETVWYLLFKSEADMSIPKEEQSGKGVGQKALACGLQRPCEISSLRDDTLTCDSACLTSLLVIADILGEDCGPRTSTPEACELLEARTHSLEAVKDKKSKIICEVLDPRTERVLWRNENLNRFAYFFRSKALETGIFMMAMHVVLCDPMLATGGSALTAIQVLKKAGVKEENIMFINVVSCPEGLKALAKEAPGVRILTCGLDSHLNEVKFIVPGLGDFGDRYYGTAGYAQGFWGTNGR